MVWNLSRVRTRSHPRNSTRKRATRSCGVTASPLLDGKTTPSASATACHPPLTLRSPPIRNSPVLTPTANPSLSFPLNPGKAVEKSTRDTLVSSQVAQLTQRLAAGEEAAFGEFHAQYFDPLYRFLLAVTRGSEHEAREALQETMLRVIRYARAFQSEDAFWSWLKVLARSAARD